MRKLRRNVASRSQDQGAILIMVALLTPVILVLIAAMVMYGYSSTVRSELQTAADAAAHAGAAVLCSTQECYDNALNAAITVLQEHQAHKSLGGTEQFANFAFPIDPEIGPYWEFGTLTVKIDRGRWLNISPDPPFFESFEGTSWKDANPGIPVVLAVNAVRVSLERPSLFSFFDKILPGVLSAEADAVAVGGPITAISAPPFAIPACALLGINGVSTPAEYCAWDRIFTDANHYCPTGDDCDLMPEFTWDPKIQSVSQFSPSITYWNPPGGTQPTKDRACFWGTPFLEDVRDHFAVFGIAGVTQDASEALVQQYLNGPNPGQPMRIGDAFSVLGTGLTEPLSNEIVWKQIVNAYSGDEATHPAWASQTDLHPYNINENVAYDTRLVTSRTNPNSPVRCATSGIDGNPSTPPYPMRPHRGGTCNSMRSGWGHWNSTAFPGAGAACLTSYDPPFSPGSAFGTLPVWQTKVAVIADPQGAPCRGLDGSDVDPPIIPGQPYQVIGFVTMNIIDTDIGKEAPTFPHFCQQPCPPDHTTTTPPYNDADTCLQYMTPYGTGGEGSQLDVTVAQDYDYPWGFRSEIAENLPCNLVRARITCDTNFIASTGGGNQRKPVLVD